MKYNRKEKQEMRVEIDTHTHTLASGHAYNTLNEMAQAAADKGLKGLAITEHAPEMSGTCHLFYFQNLRIVGHHWTSGRREISCRYEASGKKSKRNRNITGSK